MRTTHSDRINRHRLINRKETKQITLLRAEIDNLNKDLSMRYEKKKQEQEMTRLPLFLADTIQPLIPLYGFVETGTSIGNTTSVMAPRFTQAFSIELDSITHEKARTRLASIKHLTCLLGNSVELLPEILTQLNGPALFWLDGHWSGPGTAKGSIECPILTEIQLVQQANKDHVLFIDDVRLFQAPPPPPHDPAQWPELKNLVEVIEKDKLKFIFRDVLIVLPSTIRTVIWFDTFKESKYKSEILCL